MAKYIEILDLVAKQQQSTPASGTELLTLNRMLQSDVCRVCDVMGLYRKHIILQYITIMAVQLCENQDLLMLLALLSPDPPISIYKYLIH